MVISLIRSIIELVIAWYIFDIYLTNRGFNSPFILKHKNFNCVIAYILGWTLLTVGGIGLFSTVAFYIDKFVAMFVQWWIN